MNIKESRNRLPTHERRAVSNEELRIADQVSDEEFCKRLNLEHLMPRFPNLRTGKSLLGEIER